MPQPPLQATPVLDYGSQSPARGVWRRMWPILFVLICGAIGAFLAFYFSPVRFQAWGLVKVAPAAVSGAGTIGAQQQAAVTAMLSPSAISAGIAKAKINGVTLTPQQVADNLKVRVVRSSELVEVVGTNDVPEVAAATIAGVMESYVASNPSARIVGGPGIPTRQQVQPLIILFGMTAGLVSGWIVIMLRKQR